MITIPETGNPPRVSILTPSYNQVRWLPDNLRSVSVQTYRNVEHIVMDGGSGDGSADVLARHDDDRLVWDSASDNGQSDALNKAFARSTGDIIGWLNSDDAYFSPNTIAWVVAAFEQIPTVDLAYGHAALANASGEILQVLWAPRAAQSLMRLHNFLCQPAVFVRRRVLGDRMVDPAFDFMMDWELWLRLAQRVRFTRINRILAIDRHQPGRKVIVQQGIGELDESRLRSMYGLRREPWVPPVRKALKISYRLMGTTRIGEVRRASLAFDGRRTSSGKLLIRQVAVPRSRMPFDD